MNQIAGVLGCLVIVAAQAGLGRFNSNRAGVVFDKVCIGLGRRVWERGRRFVCGGKIISIHSLRTAFVQLESDRVCVGMGCCRCS